MDIPSNSDIDAAVLEAIKEDKRRFADIASALDKKFDQYFHYRVTDKSLQRLRRADKIRYVNFGPRCGWRLMPQNQETSTQ